MIKNEIKYQVRLALLEQQNINEELLNESLIIESFIDSAKTLAGNLWNKGIETIGDIKDLAYVFGKVSSDEKIAKTTSDYFFKVFERNILKNLYTKLDEFKLNDIKDKIEILVKKIKDGSYSNKIKFILGTTIGSITQYLLKYIDKIPKNQNGINKLRNFILSFLSTFIISKIIDTLTDIKSYFGFIGEIIGSISILIEVLKPITSTITSFIKSGGRFFLAKESVNENTICNIIVIDSYKEGINK
jgi:hypothetical protein